MMNKNLKFSFWLLLPFLGVYLLFKIVWLVISMLGYQSASEIIERFSKDNMPYIASFLHLLIGFIAYKKVKEKISLWEIKRKDFFGAIGIGLIAIVIIIVVLNIQASYGITLETGHFTTSMLLFIALVTSITAGFSEEIYFRAFLFDRSSIKTKWVFIFLSSISFAIWHPNWTWFAHTFLVGLLFGWYYLKIKRILPVILAHVFTDMTLGLMAYFLSV